MSDILAVEQLTQKVQGKKHSPELQSVRGIAALVVLLHHAVFYLDYGPGMKFWAEFALNAHAAVVCFFVLSGFVLTISLRNSGIDRTSVLAFYVRRVFRIYPALWLATAVGLLYLLLARYVPFPPSISDWGVGVFGRGEVDLQSLVAGLLGVGMPTPLPVWSLTIEIAGSLLIPLFVLVLLHGQRAFVLLTLLFAVISFLVIEHDPFLLAAYMVDFLIGAAALPLFEAAAPWLAERRRALLVAVLALLVMLFFRQWGPWRFLIDYHARLPSLVEALAAAALVGVIHVNPQPFGLLRRQIWVWLGDISYSFYLLHLPILGAWALILGSVLDLQIFASNPLAATGLLTLLTLVTSAAAAALGYRFVEVPGIQLGKHLLRFLPAARPRG